jgi:hypothetical protein
MAVDVNTLLARMAARLGQASQTMEIQQLQIEKLQAALVVINEPAAKAPEATVEDL